MTRADELSYNKKQNIIDLEGEQDKVITIPERKERESAKEYVVRVLVDNIWVHAEDFDTVKKMLDSRTMLVFDHFDRPLILFANQFTLNYFVEKNPDIKLLEALDVKQF